MGRPVNDKFFVGNLSNTPSSKDGLQIRLTLASYTGGPTDDSDSWIAKQRSDHTFEVTNGTDIEVLRLVNSTGTIPEGTCALRVKPFRITLQDEEAQALTWDASRGEFLWKQDHGTGPLFSVTPTGVHTLIGNVDHRAKGLAFIGTTLYSVTSDDDVLRTINPVTAATLSTVTITLAGETVEGATGLATKSGTLWAVLKLESQFGRELVTINETTGVATSIGDTEDKFAGLAFGASGTVLYAVSGDGATIPETLFSLDQTTAEPTSVLTLGAGSDGEAIGFNPDDGLIYHASGHDGPDVIFEKINGSFTGTTNIPILEALPSEYVSSFTANNVKTFPGNSYKWSHLKKGIAASLHNEVDFEPTLE